MAKPSPTSTSESEADFELKHRITGAAVLLFFGALFLPWLLGPPSSAVKVQASEISTTMPAASGSEIEEELLLALQQEEPDELEQVYISKITPLDASSDAVKSPEPKKPASTPAAKPPSNKTATAKLPAKATTKVSPPKVATAKVATTSLSTAEPIVKDSNLEKDSKTITENGVEPSAAIRVEVGWVVQVGIYTNSNGVAKILADLRSKGFSPSTSVVDTNQGKATGTRVWLGPFSQRVDAAKSKTRLTEKTGEAGFIRAYP